MTRIEEIAAVAESVQGWLLPEAGPRLYQLALEAPVGIAIEIGSWRGKSSIWIASGLADREGGGTLYCIDTWRGSDDEPIHAEIIATLGPNGLYEEFEANLRRARVRDHVVSVRSNSSEASKDTELPDAVGLLFIDAGHSEREVLADYMAWSGRIVSGGYLVMDDVPGWPGPTKVAREVAATEFELLEERHNQWVGRRT